MSFVPVFMRDAEVKIALHAASGGPTDESAATAYECEIRSVTLTPDVSIEKIRTLCPSGQYSNASPAEWELELGYLTGYHDDGTESFSDFIFANMGKKADVYFRPIRGGAGYKVTATIQVGAIGGEEGSFSEQSATFPIDGQPTKLTAQGSTLTPIVGVTGGAPGSFTPPGATVPADLAALKADTTVGDTGSAKPGPAWTTGQYVALGDGSEAFWNGTGWAVGKAA